MVENPRWGTGLHARPAFSQVETNLSGPSKRFQRNGTYIGGCEKIEMPAMPDGRVPVGIVREVL